MEKSKVKNENKEKNNLKKIEKDVKSEEMNKSKNYNSKNTVKTNNKAKQNKNKVVQEKREIKNDKVEVEKKDSAKNNDEKGNSAKNDSTKKSSEKKNSEKKDSAKKSGEEKNSTKIDSAKKSSEKKDTEKKDGEKKNSDNKKIKEVVKENIDNEKKVNNNLNIKNKDTQENKPNNFEKVKTKKKIKCSILIIIFILVILLLIAIFTIPSIMIRNGDKLAKGISINGISVGEKTFEEAQSFLNERANEIINSDLKIVVGEEYENSINLSQISANYNINKALEEAQEIGRTSNIFESSLDVLKTRNKGKDINIDVLINNEELTNVFNNISQELPGRVTQWSYSVDNNNNLIITKGKKGIVIDEEATIKNIEEALTKALKGEKVEFIQLATKEVEPEAVDVDKIHNEVYREPKNAYVTQNPFGVFVHVDGIDFNVDEVKNLLASDEQEYKIALTVTKPEITTKDLGQEAFPDVLGKTYKTTYSAGDRNRNTNIEIAARTVNGTILMPGETFSYNGILGDTTPDKGYKLGGAYLNGQVVQSYGGGICQVSSTIYNAVLYANLEVNERYNHTYLSGYVPAGLDATVSYGSKDFKFTNNRKFPIKLVCTAQNGTISATIYGIKQDDDCEVKLQSVVTSYIAPTVKYESTNTLKAGVEKVKQSGSSGCKCTVYRTILKDGKEISKEVLHSDVYSAKQKIILRGTKK